MLLIYVLMILELMLKTSVASLLLFANGILAQIPVYDKRQVLLAEFTLSELE